MVINNIIIIYIISLFTPIKPVLSIFQQTAKLVHNDISQNDFFGGISPNSVSLDSKNNRIIVGAPREDQKGTNAGSAFIFEKNKNNNNWIQFKN